MNNLSGFLSFHGNVSGQMGSNLITNVEANPSGTPTEILTSIRVGDIIYSIPSGGGGGGGTNNYNELLNKPKINNVTLSGELSLSDLGIYNPVVMIGSTSLADGAAGYAPQPLIADKDKFLKGDGTWADIPSGNETEILSITAGNGATSRTFTFTKKPKLIFFSYIASGWGFNRFVLWGSDRSYYSASQSRIADSGVYSGVSGLSFDDDNNSFTITGVNALQAVNTSDISGYMVIIY